jgi:hypothetical protein
MRPAFRAALAALVLLCSAVGALADIPPSGWEWPWERDARIRRRDEMRRGMDKPQLNLKATTLPLIIRPGRARLTTILSLPGGSGDRPRAEFAPAEGDRPGLPAGHTIVVGLALSASLVLGGLWLARRRSRRAQAGFACVFAAVVVVGLSCGPGQNEVIRKDSEGKLPVLDPPTMQADGSLAGRCRLERGSGDEVVLSINHEALTQLAIKAPLPSPAERASQGDEPGVPITVSVDERATEARLIVPKKHLDAVAAVLPNGGACPVRWPVIAVPVAVALALGGLWLTVLRPRPGAGSLAVLLGVLVLGASGVTAWANPAMPPMSRFQADVPPLTGKVTVEVVEEGESVHLILNRDMLKDLAGKP